MRGIASGLVLLALPLAAQADIIKCVNAAGQVAYQDSRCPPGAEETVLKIRGGRVKPVGTTSQPEIETRDRVIQRHEQVRSAREQRQSLPVFDTERHCDDFARSASDNGARNASMYNLCIESEQAAYNAAANLYQQVNGGMKEECADFARSVEGGAYSMLKLCLEAELNAIQRPAQFQR